MLALEVSALLPQGLVYMVAVDGSSRAMEAFVFAARLASRRGAAVRVVHLLDAASADATGEHALAGASRAVSQLPRDGYMQELRPSTRR